MRHVVVLVLLVLFVQLVILVWRVSGGSTINRLFGHLLAHESAKNLALVGDDALSIIGCVVLALLADSDLAAVEISRQTS